MNLAAIRQGIAENLRENLIFDKATGRTNRRSSMMIEYHSYNVLFTDVDAFFKLMPKGKDSSISELVERTDCVSTVIGIIVNYKIERHHEKIMDSHINRAVRQYLKPLIFGSSAVWNIVDCKILKLYDDGAITWDELVKAHTEDCTV